MSLGSGQISIIDYNDITTGGVPPTSPVKNQMWLDTSTTPSILKRYNGSTWDKVSDPTNDINNAINKIGIGGRNLMRNSGNITSTTYWSSNSTDSATVSVEEGAIKGISSIKHEFTSVESDAEYVITALVKFNSPTEIPISNKQTPLHIHVLCSENSGLTNFSPLEQTRQGEYKQNEFQLYTYKIRTSANLTNMRLRFMIYESSVLIANKYSIWVKQVKIEKGNKATDWTPAIEDIEEDITNAQTSANTANSLLSDIANDNKLTPTEKFNTKKEWDIIVSEKVKIDANATTYGITTEKAAYNTAYTTLSNYITPLLSSMTTTSDIVGVNMRSNFTNYYNARQDLLNKINSRAKELADAAQSSIDNLEIGGRNLCKNSAPTTNMSFAHATTPVGRTFTTDTSLPSGKVCTFEYTSAGQNGGYIPSITNFPKIAEGTTCSWSVYVKASKSITLGIGLENGGAINVPITTDWQKVTNTFVANNSTTSAFIFYSRTNMSIGDTVSFSSLKIEYGNKATDWTPAPEDFEEKIQANTTALTVAQGQISALISEDSIIKGNVTTLQNNYASIEATVNGINSTVASHTTSISNVNTLANSKAKVFSSTPTVPYNVGDLWVAGANGDIMRCKTARTTGSYTSTDWEKASKYTDDTKATTVEGNLNTLAGRVTTTEDNYTSLSQNLEGFKTTVGSTYSTKTELGTVNTLANSKAKVFTTTPTIPYNVGDLWVGGSSSNIMRCKTARTSGSYTASDWEKADKYTDDTKANAVETNLNGVISRVSATESSITQLNNSIALKVEASDVTTTVNNAVNSIQVGGRNYALKSNVEKNLTAYYVLYDLSVDKYNMQGKTITVSFDAKKVEGSASVNMYSYFRSSSAAITPNSNKIGDVTTEYVRYTTTLQAPTDLSTAISIGIHASIQNSNVYVKNVKVEIGNKATDWTPAPEDIDASISSMETRISNAETKIEPQAITNAVENYINNDGSTVLTTKSELRQTSDKIIANFKQAGAYNLIKNSTGYGGTKYWNSATVNNRGLNNSDIYGDYGFKLENSTTTRNSMTTYNIPVVKNTKYTISFYAHNTSNCSFDFSFMGNTTIKNESEIGYEILRSIATSQTTNNEWKQYVYILTIPNTVVQGYFRFANNGSTNGAISRLIINKFCVTEGDSITKSDGTIIPPAWTPHISEVYEGIVKLDKDGIEVTSSNVKSKTTMSSTGFKITKTDTNEDVFKVNSDGTLTLKGSMTITGGSIPAGNLTGTVDNARLNSAIVSGATAGTSAQTTLNSNSANWTNAFNRVSNWTSAGTTTIDGGKITANTILADKIAISDFTNYCQLNKTTLSKYGFTEEVVTGNVNWFVKTDIRRDNQISEWFPCNGGETLRIKGDVWSVVTGSTTNGGTTSTNIGTSISIFGTNADDTKTYHHPIRIINNTNGVVDATVTLPLTCRQFAVFLQHEGYPLSGQSFMGGTLKVRNIQVTKMASGELIVDGAITANKLNVENIFADTAFINKFQSTEIKAEKISGTISNEILNLNGFITFESLSSQFEGIFDTTGADKTYINGNRILTGSITADKVNTRGLVAKNENNQVTFEIKEDTGDVVINNAFFKSSNFIEGSTGYQLSTDGIAEFNQATIRGKVVLPNAGITNDYDFNQTEGRNLLHDTNKGITNWGWNTQTGGKTLTEVVEDNIRTCKMTRDSVAQTGWNVIAYSGIDRSVYDYKPSKKYTLSMEVKTSSTLNKTFSVCLLEGDGTDALSNTVTFNKPTVANQWVKISATLTIVSTLPTSTGQVVYITNSDSSTGVYYQFKNIKLEEGEVATDWSPAPEDNLNPVRIWAGADESGKDTAPFRVMQDGSIYATRGNFEGTFTGEVNVGNIKIFDTVNSDSYIQLYDNTDNTVLSQISGEKDSFFTGNFYVKKSGTQKRLIDIYNDAGGNNDLIEINTSMITLGDDGKFVSIPTGDDKIIELGGINGKMSITIDSEAIFSLGKHPNVSATGFIFTRDDYSPINMDVIGNLYVQDEFKIGDNGMKIVGLNDTNGKGYDFIVI